MQVIEVIAEKAVSLIKGSKQRATSIKNTRNIILSGVKVFGLILYRYFENGSPLSLAIAKPILDVTVILLNPAKNILIISITVIEIAPALFKFPSESVNASLYTLTTA